MIGFQRIYRLALALLVLAATTGCESTPKQPPRIPTRPVMTITNHTGGAHYRTIVRDNIWYQTFANELLVIDPQTVQPIRTVELGEFGTCGPAVDMAIVDAELYIVLEDDEVVHLSLDDPINPVIVERRTADDLNLLPRRLSIVDHAGESGVYVCGDGGAARFAGGPVLLPGLGVVRSIARAEMGLVAAIGRRVYRVDDGSYVGAATELRPLPGDPDNGLLFIQQGESGALIGIMEPNVRERNARTFTTAVSGPLHQVRCFDGSIWIITNEQILAYTPGEEGLELREVFRVRGALDVDMIRENYLAVAGTFGRAVYRIRDDSNGLGDQFLLAQRDPGFLQYAISDRMQVLAGSPDQGTWLYQIGSDAKLLDQQFNREPPVTREVVTDDGTATISDDSESITLRENDISLQWRHPKGHALHCVIAVEGRLWIGHERGVVILEPTFPTAEQIAAAEKDEMPPPQPRFLNKGEVWLHGPVRYLFGLLTGRGVAYVATYSGFGTIEMIEEPIPASERAPDMR